MKNSIQLFFSILFLLFFVKCAKRTSPSGGPKDSIPPRLINASPKLNTTFFDKDGFTLTFDEYVTLKDVNKQLIVSPPLSSTKYKIYPTTGASKKISLELSDSLMKNTTYTFNFGESIVDFNESNPAQYLTYTLSTGPTIDSLYVRGRITDAFEKETKSFISVQLYPIDSTYKDSTIYINKPLYVTSTLDSIIYRFQNLRAGKYNLIAIQDLAGNYLFDQSVDKIGFIEQPIDLPKDSIINLSIFKERTNFYWDAPYFINDHHVALGYFGEYNDESFKTVVNTFNRKLHDYNCLAKDQYIQNILDDFSGQVKEALNMTNDGLKEDWFSRWGIHYLRSLQEAYKNEMCNNFKDKGILNFKSRMFDSLCDSISTIFDYQDTFYIFLISSIIASFIGIAILIKNKKILNFKIPFGSYLCFVSVIYYFI